MTLETGIAIISVVCFILSRYLLRVKSHGLRTVMLILCPYSMAWLLYWGIATFEGITSQHSSWEGVFVHPWAASGYVSILVGLFVFSQTKVNRNNNT